MRKNEVNVLSDPEHTIVSFVYVGNTFPIHKESHEFLGELKKISDIIFIFSKYHYNKQSGINKEKFSSLYQACAFIENTEKSLGNATLKMLAYCDKIFNKHISYVVFNLDDIYEQGVDNSVIKKIEDINASTIKIPIYKERRLTSEEFCNIYKKFSAEEEASMDLSYWLSFNKIFPKKIDEDITGMYSGWHVESPIMLFKIGTIKAFTDRFKDESFLKMINSFEEGDPRYMIASIMKRYGYKTMNVNIEDVKI